MNITNLYQLFKEHTVISTDTRQDLRNSLFFAIKGTKYDSNLFAGDALQKGAAYAIIDNPDIPQHPNFILVDDTIKSLQELAIYHRKQLRIPIIAITGSNGKTTTKELIYRVLNKSFNTFITPGNLNNHIGVPLSLLKITNQHQMAILELGANHQGENELLTSICLPDYGLTTNIGKDHLGEFGGVEAVIKSYKEFIDYFNKNKNLTFFLNKDDDNITRLIKSDNIISYSIIPGNRYKVNCLAENIENQLYLKTKIFSDNISEFIINTHLFGSFNLHNISAAVCIGLYFKIEPILIKQAIEEFIPDNNRSQFIHFKDNVLILDAYNANPSSMELAIKDFSLLNHKKKLIILGDMFELGKYSETEHYNIIKLLKSVDLKDIILVGPEFKKHKSKINSLYFEDSTALSQWINVQNFSDTIIYVKASRGIQLEKAFSKLFPHN